MKITIEDANGTLALALAKVLGDAERLSHGVVRTAPAVPHSERGDIADMVLRALDLPSTVNTLAVRDALYQAMTKARTFDRVVASRFMGGTISEAGDWLAELADQSLKSDPARDTRALDATGAYMLGLANQLVTLGRYHGSGSGTLAQLTEHAETLRRRGNALVSDTPTAEATP